MYDIWYMICSQDRHCGATEILGCPRFPGSTWWAMSNESKDAHVNYYWREVISVCMHISYISYIYLTRVWVICWDPIDWLINAFLLNCNNKITKRVSGKKLESSHDPGIKNRYRNVAHNNSQAVPDSRQKHAQWNSSRIIFLVKLSKIPPCTRDLIQDLSRGNLASGMLVRFVLPLFLRPKGGHSWNDRRRNVVFLREIVLLCSIFWF